MQNQAQDAKVQWRDGKAFFASVSVNFEFLESGIRQKET